jgi:hypothetical protein
MGLLLCVLYIGYEVYRVRALMFTPGLSKSLSPQPLHPTPYTLHPTPWTLHPTPYTLHPTPYTLDPTPYTLHPTPPLHASSPETLNSKP